MYDLNLFNAEIPEVKNPLQRRRPTPNVPLQRAVRDRVEDLIERNAPDGISWAWDIVPSSYVAASVTIVLCDCRTENGLTTAVLLNDDLTLDTRNTTWRLQLFARSERVTPRRRLAS